MFSRGGCCSVPEPTCNALTDTLSQSLVRSREREPTVDMEIAPTCVGFLRLEVGFIHSTTLCLAYVMSGGTNLAARASNHAPAAHFCHALHDAEQTQELIKGSLTQQLPSNLGARFLGYCQHS